VDFNSDISGERFADMGYDSIALLEAASLIEQEYGISLDDSTVAEAETPAELLTAVNARLGAENNAA
jgi:minimal PKS acyl carrier protein